MIARIPGSIPSVLLVAAVAAIPARAGDTTAIKLSRSIVVYGGTVRLSGTFAHGQSGKPVSVYSREYGQPFRLVGVASTRRGGTWSFSFRPAIQMSFEAQSIGDTSRSPLVRVRPRVTLIARGTGFLTRVAAGRSVRGKHIELQRAAGGRWITIKRAVLERPAQKFRARLPRGVSRLRIFLPRKEIGPGYLDGFSRTIVVRR